MGSERPCWWDLEGVGFWDESVCGRELEEKNSRLVGQILLRAWRGLLDNGKAKLPGPDGPDGPEQ